MAILLRNGFFAVLDLENLTSAYLRVKHHHIKFPNGKLQNKHLLFRVCQLGFQQDDILQHPPFDLGQDAFQHGGALRKRQGTERFIQQQTANQRVRLCIAESWLGNHRAAGLRADIWQVQHINFLRQVQQVQIFLDLCHMSVVQFYSLFCFVADL